MKKIIFTIALLGLIGALFSPIVNASDTASVTATVTVQNIGIEFNSGSPTTITYGTLGSNSSADTNPAGTITMKNSGNIAEDFQLKGNTTAETPDWAIGGTAGSNIYVHKYCTASCTTPPTSYTAMTATYTDSVVSNIAAAGTQTFDFEITTPNPSTVFTEQAVDISIRAVAH